MKGNAKVVECLGKALAIEMTAINQYFLHSRMLRNWGYARVAELLFQESIGEMRHAQSLIDRMLFLDTTPDLRAGVVTTGADVKEVFESDLGLEMRGVKAYNEAIDLCVREKDAVSREIMEHILVDSESHVDWLETQLRLIDNVGLEAYLAEQMQEKSK